MAVYMSAKRQKFILTRMAMEKIIHGLQALAQADFTATTQPVKANLPTKHFYRCSLQT